MRRAGSKVLAGLAVCLGAAAPAGAALSAVSVDVVDGILTSRTQFTKSERIGFQARVRNDTASANKINFVFSVTSPSGAEVMRHSGNAAPGGIGDAFSRISGFSIEGFYSTPGDYKLKVTASLDGSIVEQEKTFSVTSPIITLTFPPQGARDLVDKPLTLRWSGTTTRYRVHVDDDPGFFNEIFSGETNGSENFFNYPENPPEDKQKLTAGTVYYWKVEGLDVNGNVIAESGTPFNFTLKDDAVSGTTRDLAVTKLELTAGAPPGYQKLKATIRNQGSLSESNLTVQISIGGVPCDGSPTSISILAPGQDDAAELQGVVPSGQSEVWAIACVNISDDNVPNNCKSLKITASSADGSGSGKTYSPTEAWAIIEELLRRANPSLLTALDGYELENFEGGYSWEEIQKIVSQLESGTAALVDATGGEGFDYDWVDDTQGQEASVALPDAPEYQESQKTYTPEEAWDIIKKELEQSNPAVLAELADYELDGFEEKGITWDEIQQLIAALAGDKAGIENAFTTYDMGDYEDSAEGMAPIEPDAPEYRADRRYTEKEAWEIIQGLLEQSDPDLLAQLEGYELESIDGRGFSWDEIEAIVSALKDGDAKIEGAVATYDGGADAAGETEAAEETEADEASYAGTDLENFVNSEEFKSYRKVDLPPATGLAVFMEKAGPNTPRTPRVPVKAAGFGKYCLVEETPAARGQRGLCRLFDSGGKELNKGKKGGFKLYRRVEEALYESHLIQLAGNIVRGQRSRRRVVFTADPNRCVVKIDRGRSGEGGRPVLESKVWCNGQVSYSDCFLFKPKTERCYFQADETWRR